MPEFPTREQLERTDAGQSGADQIGSAPISGLTGSTIWAQMASLAAAAGAAVATPTVRGIMKISKAAVDPIALITTERGAANGVASLNGSTKHLAAEIPFGDGAGQVVEGPHKSSADHDTRYYTETEVDGFLTDKAPLVHEHDGTDITSGLVDTARLGTGTRNSSTALHGDGVFRAPAGGAGGTVGVGSIQGVSPDEPGGDIAVVAASTRMVVTPNDAEDQVGLDVAQASTTQQGAIEIATDAETQAGTDTTRAVPPSALKALLDMLLPIGGWIGYMGSTEPSAQMKFMNGQAVSRTTYATLFARLGTTYGAGDGTTTFNLPDWRGRSPIGAGQGSGLTDRVLGALLGTEQHALITDELPNHVHTFKYTQNNNSTGGGSGDRVSSLSDTGGNTKSTQTTTGANGTAHPNVHPVGVCHYLIRVA